MLLQALTIEDAAGVQVPFMAPPTRKIRGAEGFLGVSAVRQSSRDRPNAHGAINESRWTGPGLYVIDGLIVGTDPADCASEFRDLSGVLLQTLDDGPAVMRWTEAGTGGLQLQATVSLFGSLQPPVQLGAALVAYQAQMFAEDPRAYSQTLQTVDSTALSASGGGMVFPEVLPITFGQSGGGTSTVVNGGNRPTPPVFRIYGNAVNPSIVNLTTGRRIVLNGTVNAGDFLELDVLERTITLNGTTNRANFLDAANTEWFELGRGTTNLQLIAGAFDGSALLRTYFRDAYA